MYWLIYAVVPTAVGILALFSRKIALPEGYEGKGITGIFSRVAYWLYERLGTEWLLRQVAPIEKSLKILNPAGRTEDAGKRYYVKKLADLLMLLCAGSVLGIALYVAARQNHVFSGEGMIDRAAYMEEDRLIRLDARETDGTPIGAFDVTVSAQRYTAEETEALFHEASDLLPALILAENTALEQVTTDLALVDAVPGYPFSITWKSGNYGRIRSDGRLDLEDIPEDGEVVMLTACYRYEDYEYEQILYAHVRSPIPDEETLRRQSMEALLTQADEATATDSYLQLPDTLDQNTVQWTEQIRDNSSLIFLLMIIAAVAVFIARDREVKRQMELRSLQMLSDYPQFVSQLVLYLGAGMSVRGIIKKLGSDYAKKREAGGEMRFLQEELLRMAYSLESGVVETQVYEQFSLRCGIRQYTRLCTLLTQNLRKGSNDLLRVLEEESKKAFSERIDLARKRGEEAGTKLLVPMMLLLGIVMIIIIIPAYTAF